MKQHLLTVGAVLCFALTSAQIPTAGLVAYWPMNGNFANGGSTTVNITNVGATATTNANGTLNSAMAFNNPTGTVSNYGVVTANAAINFTGDFSIDFSFYINTPYAHAMGFFDNGINLNSASAFGYGVWFWNSGGNRLVFSCRNNAVQSVAGSIPLATWVHATFVRAAGTLKIYINGVLNASGPEGTSTLGYTGVTPKLGTMTYLFQSPQEYNGLYGKLDEMRIYNRALTQTEISAIQAGFAGGPLPVKLSIFNAALQNNNVLLQWQTEFEQNSDYYTIQQSTDGINFINIGKVQAKGTSSVISSYQFADNNISAFTGIKALYYRLVSTDKDGRTQNSSIISIRIDAAKQDGLMVLQNPVSDQLNLQLSSSVKENGTIIITDVSGRQLISKSVPLNTGNVFTAIPVHMLAAGNYYITLISSQGKQTKSFLRQ